MKTGDLIHAMVEDQQVATPLLSGDLVMRWIGGLVFSLLLFFVFLGVRADFMTVYSDPHVIFKFVFGASIFLSLIPLLRAALRPETNLIPIFRWVMLPIGVLGCGVAFQLITSPAEFWSPGMLGRFPAACLKSIPALAIGPLFGLLLLLRRGAPTHPVLSGSVAGAASGGLAAFIYALHCPDDSALFVAVWYSLAIGITTLVGAAVGAKWLRW